MPRAYSRERRAELTTATRTRIVDAVHELILEVGPDAITLPLVAERADLALRTLYNHFPSRAELLSAALLDLAQRMSAFSLDVRQRGLAGPREELRAYIRGVYQAYEAQAPSFDALLLANNRELDRTIAEARARGRRSLVAILEPADRDGTLALPTEQAAVLGSIQTLYPVWRHLTRDLGLSTAEASALVGDMLDRALFVGAAGSPVEMKTARRGSPTGRESRDGA
ncbi:MAG: TetR/AcrR family transcriptional regulator [Dehalococcoidia bacterium]